MRRRMIITAMLLATLSTIGTSQQTLSANSIMPGRLAPEEEERISGLFSDVQSLVGVKGVYVLIESLHEDAKVTGLTEHQLKTDIELKLRMAGIKVNSPEEYRASDDCAYLYLNINLFDRNTGLFSLGVSLEFKQNVYLARSPNRLCRSAVTWGTHAVGRCGSYYLLDFVRDAVKDKTDEFINDYLTANPKK